MGKNLNPDIFAGAVTFKNAKFFFGGRAHKLRDAHFGDAKNLGDGFG